MLDPEYVCWCFDNAVEWVNGYVEQYLSQHDEKKHGDFDRYFQRLFEDEGKDMDDAEVFRQLVQMFGAPIPVK